MKILKDSLLCLASEGRKTLQIPECEILISDTPYVTTYDECPDEWVTYLHSTSRPTIGKESGFLYFTRAGWEANREAILAAYVKGVRATGRCDPNATDDYLKADFIAYTEKHFADVQKKLDALIKDLEKKLTQAKKLKI